MSSSAILPNFYCTLRSGGRIGIQAPAKKNYCPNFIKAVEEVKRSEFGRIFTHFKSPWFFLDNEVVLCEIEEVRSNHSPEKVFGIFTSGVSAGYLNPEFYNAKVDDGYFTRFAKIVRKSFERKTVNGTVELKFHRVFLVALKGDF